MVFNDIREFITEAERLGEYKLVEGADWDLEIGFITEWQGYLPNSPLVLFDKIKGYPPGYRVVTNLFTTPRRTAVALGFPGEPKGIELVKQIRDKLSKGFEMLPPVEAKTAPVKENIYRGDEVDLFKFPTPKYHRLDGGRYIGTGHIVIMRDPDDGWVNCGTYRLQIQSKSTVTIVIVPGKHGDLIMRKWWSKGLSCPVAIATGLDPMLFGAGTFDLGRGTSEYDFVGGWRGKPIEVTPGLTVDLPIPATAEIVLEGELIEGETADEGPFGEYSGYYGGPVTKRPVVRVNAILHRNNPIIHGAPPHIITPAYSLAHTQLRAANAWNLLDKLVPGVKGVWMPNYDGVIVSIEQQYLGHAKQTGLAVLGIPPTSFLQTFIIVVDDDIDPSNLDEVIWVLTTRCDPATSIDIVRGIRSHVTHPQINPEKKKRGDYTSSCAIILACRPYEWKDEFPPTIRSSPEELEKVREKWGVLFQ